MSAEAIIKTQARDTLKGNYVRAVSALLIVLLPFYIIDGATTIISYILSCIVSDDGLRTIIVMAVGYPLEIAGFILFSPIINGYIRTYYRAAYTKDMDMNDVFYYFTSGRYKSALSLNMGFILRMLLPVLLIFLPFIIFEIISANIGEEFNDTLLYFDIHFILMTLSVLTTIMYSLRYFTAFTITADNEYLTAKQAFEYARFIRKSSSGSAVKLLLSFIPWMLLCLLVLPMLYVIPYITQSMCVSAKWMTMATFEVN